MELISTNGIKFLIDKEDLELVSQGVWWVWNSKKTATSNKSQYVWWNHSRGVAAIKLHRWILGVTDPKRIVDHINGNGLDNRRANLRLCSETENRINQGPREDNKLGVKGVSFHKASGKFIAQINIEGKRTHLGCFTSIEQAAAAYAAAEIKYYGKFANAHLLSRRSNRVDGNDTIPEIGSDKNSSLVPQTQGMPSS